ncbi:MAG: FtsW/RodA/SpoVE family cell cycle protein, partial [Clostridia bacterium]|nr:FtsW/RodA/SpoVE family cell cycle protein [Clostridia bacterium]
MAKGISTEKPAKIKRKQGKIDITFLSLILILLTIGLIMLFSASYAYSLTYYNNSFKFILRQSIFAAVGLVVMFIFSKIDYHVYRKFSWLVYAVSIAMLAFLLIMPPMIKGMDVKRWIAIGPLTFQPSEIAKFAIVLLFAHLIAANYNLMSRFKFIALLAILLGIVCGLVIFEPHISATLLIGLIGVLLMIIGGLNWKYIAMMGGVIGVGALAIVSGVISYGSDRIKYWINPWADPTDLGYQTIQSLLAIGSGGIMGRGLGKSRQKYLWVPEPHNDFIFSIVCEELGIIGAMIIILLFCALVWRGFTIAIKAPDKFGCLLSLGLTFQVGLQAILNILVVTNTIPNTGISLPFFSYGGTSLVLLLAQMGFILSVSRQTQLKKLLRGNGMHILFAGGGTAGHVNPALAIAGYIKKKHPDAKISYIGTPDKIESKLVPECGYDFYTISVRGFQRKLTPKGIAANVSAVSKAVSASIKSRKLLKQLKPDVVIGTGGYVCGPVLREANKLGFKTAIHEQNAFPGVTIKMLAPKADCVMLAMPEAEKYIKSGVKPVITGNPVRQALFEIGREEARKKLGIGEEPLILSFGGSLG